MKRERKLVLLSHCILNVNAKVEGIATSKSGITELVTSLMNRGYGIIQAFLVWSRICVELDVGDR